MVELPMLEGPVFEVVMLEVLPLGEEEDVGGVSCGVGRICWEGDFGGKRGDGALL
jgi:hypothetical protein